jgi:hypothetical protein
MEVKGQLQTPRLFSMGRVPSTCWKGGCVDPKVCLDASDKERLPPLGIDQRLLRCQRRNRITKLSCVGCIFSVGLILEVMLYKIYSDNFSLFITCHGKCVAFRLISIVVFGGQHQHTEDCMLWLCCKSASAYRRFMALWHKLVLL